MNMQVLGWIEDLIGCSIAEFEVSPPIMQAEDALQRCPAFRNCKFLKWQ